MSDGALQTLKLGMAMGFGERFVPEMADIVLRAERSRERRLKPKVYGDSLDAHIMHNACTAHMLSERVRIEFVNAGGLLPLIASARGAAVAALGKGGARPVWSACVPRIGASGGSI